MRVLLVNQFYPPDPAPTGLYLRDLARELGRRGHAVEVWTGRAPYAPGATSGLLDDEDDDGVRVRRLGRATDAAVRDHVRRGARAAGFLARVALGAARVDLVVALTSPPFLGVAAAHAARRHGARLAHWVMDAYPDALVSHGLVAPRGPLASVLRALARRAYARAAVVVALGPFMAQRVRALVPAPVPVESVELWGDPGPRPTDARVRAERRALGFTDDELVLLYSGNLGLGHRLEEFLEAARRLGSAGPRWVFAGGGARRAQLEAFRRAHPDARLELQPYLDEPGHTLRLLAADVHLASLAEAWQGVIVPSKVQAAMALGRPLLFVGPAHNEPASWVRDSGGGWTCAPGDVGALLAALSAACDPDERARRGAAAAHYARLHFDRARGVARLAERLEATCAGGASLSRS